MVHRNLMYALFATSLIAPGTTSSAQAGNNAISDLVVQAGKTPQIDADGRINSRAGGKSAKSCFGAQLVATGARLELEYRTKSTFGNSVIDSSVIQVIKGQRKFNGTKALLAESESTVTENGRTTVAHADSYIVVDKKRRRVTNLGGTGETFVDERSSGTGKFTFTPGLLFRYDLKPGQSYSQKVSVKSVTRSMEGNFTDRTKQKVKTTYIGMESVKVPAGKFMACKYRVTTTITQQGFDFDSTRTVWYGVDLGLEVKDKSDQGSSSVLVSAKINGKKL